MSRLRIDFAWPRPARRRAALVIAACVLVSAWAWMAWRHATLQSELDGWQTDRERLSRRESAARAPGSAAGKERLQTELRLANRVIDALNRPWDDLFSAVDTARSDKATLLAVEPDTERREVRLTAEAKDLAGMLDYLKKVRATPALKNAALAEHQISVQDAQRPVRFSILAGWAKAPRTPAAAAPPAAEATPTAVPGAQP